MNGELASTPGQRRRPRLSWRARCAGAGGAIGSVVVVGALVFGTLGGTSSAAPAAEAAPVGWPLPVPLVGGHDSKPVLDSYPQPAWAKGLTADTTQVIRTVRSHHWCQRVYCTQTEAWEKVDGRWRLAKGPGRDDKAVFRSTIGPRGFAPVGKRREDDGRTPSGAYAIAVTFSATPKAPGEMPWRRRLPGSYVSSSHGKYYNTWLDDGSGGTRPSMQYGFWVDYNHPRLVPGQGPEPVAGLGSGIFYHTSWPNSRWVPTIGCTAIGEPSQMKWVLQWLRPQANPRVLNNI
ncbi:MAG TPA: L,D-transpeptidase family protein [Sporichthyaceae bacterium]|nr:L,D-transpeptidase family protein [Sporichthyaceae bacterium]